MEEVKRVVRIRPTKGKNEEADTILELHRRIHDLTERNRLLENDVIIKSANIDIALSEVEQYRKEASRLREENSKLAISAQQARLAVNERVKLAIANKSAGITEIYLTYDWSHQARCTATISTAAPNGALIENSVTSDTEEESIGKLILQYADRIPGIRIKSVMP